MFKFSPCFCVIHVEIGYMTQLAKVGSLNICVVSTVLWEDELSSAPVTCKIKRIRLVGGWTFISSPAKSF